MRRRESDCEAGHDDPNAPWPQTPRRIAPQHGGEPPAASVHLRDGKTTDELILAVDGKLAHALSDTSTLTANLGIGYDTQAGQASMTTSFSGGGAAFTPDGINPSSTVVRGGLGMVINASDAMEFTARYDIETRSGYAGQTVSVKFRMPF